MAKGERSGKFVVQIPKSLHAALAEEADREGVSLNHLVLAKLAVSLGKGIAMTRPGSNAYASLYERQQEMVEAGVMRAPRDKRARG